MIHKIIPFVICIFLILCFSIKPYSNMQKSENTQEMWRNLVFLDYDEGKLLVDRGVDINSRGNDGKTFLMVASEFGAENSVQALVKLGADVNAKDDSGNTALLFAEKESDPKIITFLVKHGAHK